MTLKRWTTPGYRAYRRVYQTTPEFKAARLKYNSSPKGQATFRTANIRRRMRKLALPYVAHEASMPADGLCPHCDVRMIGKYPALDTPTQDHIVPITKGGHHVPSNTEMICLGCNIKKHNRPLSDLLLKIAKEEFG